jgi:spore germination protein GerM
MQFQKYTYIDADGVNRVQVNIEGFRELLQKQGAMNIAVTPMTNAEVKAYIKG